MEFKLIKGAKSTEVVKVLNPEAKAKTKASANVDANGDLKLSKWSNEGLAKFGGVEKIVNRLKKQFPELKIEIVDAAPAPTPEPVPAPTNG